MTTFDSLYAICKQLSQCDIKSVMCVCKNWSTMSTLYWENAVKSKYGNWRPSDVAIPNLSWFELYVVLDQYADYCHERLHPVCVMDINDNLAHELVARTQDHPTVFVDGAVCNFLRKEPGDIIVCIHPADKLWCYAALVCEGFERVAITEDLVKNYYSTFHSAYFDNVRRAGGMMTWNLGAFSALCN